MTRIRTGGSSPPPLTTKGDLLTFGTALSRLPVGPDGQVLTADAAQAFGVKWAAAAAGASARVALANLRSGSISSTATAYAALPGLADLTVPGAVGDVLEVGLSYISGNNVDNLHLDAVTVVAGVLTSFISGAGSGGAGVSAWTSRPGFNPAGGSVMYKLVAGDIDAGNANLRLLFRSGGGSAVSFQTSATVPLQFWIKNLGAVG